jgi:predicted nucleotidyltransferase
MTIPKDIVKNNPSLSDWNIITAYRGSIAHGLYVPKSDPNSIDDKDVMAVCLPPLEYYFGLKTFGSRGTKEIFIGEWDIVIYEFKKFISLLLKGNPNVIGLLWMEEKNYINIHPIGYRLIKLRSLFSSKQIYYSFVGYAKGQFKRMERFKHNGYMGAKRKELVSKFGYDTKNASHLIRLLRMAIEFLNTGEFIVERKHDACELLDIKKGKWTLEKVKEESKRLFNLADESFLKCQLPNKPDMEEINKFCNWALTRYFGI